MTATESVTVSVIARATEALGVVAAIRVTVRVSLTEGRFYYT